MIHNNFNIKNDMIEFMLTLSKETLVDFYDMYFMSGEKWHMLLNSCKNEVLEN